MADKSRLQEGAIISTTWLSKARTLYEPQSEEPSLVKTLDSQELEKVRPKETPIASARQSTVLQELSQRQVNVPCAK